MLIHSGRIKRDLKIITGAGKDRVSLLQSEIGRNAIAILGGGDDTFEHGGDVRNRLIVNGKLGVDTFVDLQGTPTNPVLRSIENVL